MAAGNWTVYTAPLQYIFAGGVINWGSANIRCVLLSNSYTPNENSDSTWSNISAYQVTGTGYTAGGVVVSSPLVQALAGTVTVSGSIPTWSGTTLTAAYAALVLSSGGASPAAGDPILAYVPLVSGGGTISTSAQSLTISGYSIAITHSP